MHYYINQYRSKKLSNSKKTKKRKTTKSINKKSPNIIKNQEENPKNC